MAKINKLHRKSVKLVPVNSYNLAYLQTLNLWYTIMPCVKLNYMTYSVRYVSVQAKMQLTVVSTKKSGKGYAKAAPDRDRSC